MTTSEYWKNGISGNWDTAADWSSGVVPNATVGVSLPTFGGAYTVTSNHSDSALGLTIFGGATLDVTAGVFTDRSWFNNAGAVRIESGAAYNVGFAGNYQGYGNSGRIILRGGTFRVLDAGLEMSGGGLFALSNSAANLITGGTAAAAAEFDNANQTLYGAGSISGQYFRFDNSAHGVVNACDTIGLTINTGNMSTNAGLMESTNTGGLRIVGNIQNFGELKASAGLLDVTGNIPGYGYLDIAAGGQIELGGAANQDLYFQAGSTGMLILDHGAAGGLNEIYGADAGVRFDLRDVVDNATTKPSFTISGALNEYTLSVTDGTHTDNLYLMGGVFSFDAGSFTLGVDGKGGTTVTVV